MPTNQSEKPARHLNNPWNTYSARIRVNRSDFMKKPRFQQGFSKISECIHPGSNRGPSACKADVITTTLWIQDGENVSWSRTHPHSWRNEKRHLLFVSATNTAKYVQRRARAFRIGSSRRSSDSCSSYSYELLKQSCRNTTDYSCQYINKAYEIIVRNFRLSLSLLLFHFTVVILRRGSNSSWTHLNLPILGALWWSRGRATRAMTVPFVCTPNIA